MSSVWSVTVWCVGVGDLAMVSAWSTGLSLSLESCPVSSVSVLSRRLRRVLEVLGRGLADLQALLQLRTAQRLALLAQHVQHGLHQLRSGVGHGDLQIG